MFRRARAVVGLDIGSSAVKAVEVKGSGKSFKVTAFGIEPVPPDSIVDGAIIDGAAVADAIRRLFESKNIRTKDVAASLAGNAVIVKKITLPKMTEQELAESIYWEAEQYIPFDIQDVNLDYQVVGQGSGAAAGTMDVLLVAAKKEKIADYTGVITQAGRAAVIVDVDAFALQNAYEVNYGLDPAQVVALVNFGASAVNINILSGGQSLFTRDISIGGNAYTDALQRELNLPYETADALKRGLHVEGYSLEHGAADPARGHRERAPRDPEDVRLLPRHHRLRSHRSPRGERRRLARRRLRRDAGRALRLAGRALRSVQEGELRRRRASASWRPPTCRRLPPWPWASRSGRWVTDDSHQSPRGREAGRQDAQLQASTSATRPARSARSSSCSPAASATSRWDYYEPAAQDDAQLRSELIAARAEKARLAPILKEVERFDSARRTCSSASTLIEELRTEPGRAGAHARQISRSLPDRLWLTDMKQTGDDVQMDGRTSSLSSLADLGRQPRGLGLLQASRSRSSNSEEEKNNDKDLIKFSIKATFEMPGAKKPAAPAAPGAPGTKRLAE